MTNARPGLARTARRLYYVNGVNDARAYAAACLADRVIAPATISER
jgi:hypothetical protein